MRSHLVCYATCDFEEGRGRLVASARRFGIHEVHSCNRAAVERADFYPENRAILDRPRGSGYWLWKPYMIEHVLQQLPAGELLYYLDAGVEIIRDLSPLAEFATHKGGILVFAGHYDDVAVPGPNICRRRTKRDCFVLMGCDEPRYHEAQMLDASLVVFRKTERSLAFVRAWRSHCSDARIVTDDANVCGKDNLPGFIDHRHDQSVLSLLALRHGLEAFRHPSQFGNHLKPEPLREPGEILGHPYGAKGLCHNSPYPTLLDHHRMGRSTRLLLDKQLG